MSISTHFDYDYIAFRSPCAQKGHPTWKGTPIHRTNKSTIVDWFSFSSVGGDICIMVWYPVSYSLKMKSWTACLQTSLPQSFACRNHIRVYKKFPSEDRLVVCGTQAAQDPQCRTLPVSVWVCEEGGCMHACIWIGLIYLLSFHQLKINLNHVFICI